MVIEYLWTSTDFTTYSIGLTIHMVMMDEIEFLKLNIEKYTYDISEGMRKYLYRWS